MSSRVGKKATEDSPARDKDSRRKSHRGSITISHKSGTAKTSQNRHSLTSIAESSSTVPGSLIGVHVQRENSKSFEVVQIPKPVSIDGLLASLGCGSSDDFDLCMSQSPDGPFVPIATDSQAANAVSPDCFIQVTWFAAAADDDLPQQQRQHHQQQQPAAASATVFRHKDSALLRHEFFEGFAGGEVLGPNGSRVIYGRDGGISFDFGRDTIDVLVWDGEAVVPLPGSDAKYGYGIWNGNLMKWFSEKLAFENFRTLLADLSDAKVFAKPAAEALCLSVEPSSNEITIVYPQSTAGNWHWIEPQKSLDAGGNEWLADGDVPEPVVLFAAMAFQVLSAAAVDSKKSECSKPAADIEPSMPTSDRTPHGMVADVNFRGGLIEGWKFLTVELRPGTDAAGKLFVHKSRLKCEAKESPMFVVNLKDTCYTEKPSKGKTVLVLSRDDSLLTTRSRSVTGPSSPERGLWRLKFASPEVLLEFLATLSTHGVKKQGVRKEGFLRSKERYWFVLDQRRLTYFSSPAHVFTEKARGAIELAASVVRSVDTNSLPTALRSTVSALARRTSDVQEARPEVHALGIFKTSGRKYFLFAESDDELQGWIKALRRTVESVDGPSAQVQLTSEQHSGRGTLRRAAAHMAQAVDWEASLAANLATNDNPFAEPDTSENIVYATSINITPSASSTPTNGAKIVAGGSLKAASPRGVSSASGDDLPSESESEHRSHAGKARSALLGNSDEEMPLIKGATLTKLVERATYSKWADLDFVSDFLMTFKSFTTPNELLTLLLQRYNMPEPQDPAELKQYMSDIKLIQLRVFNFLRSWIDHGWSDFENDVELHARLKAFIDRRLAAALPQPTEQLRKLIINRQQGIKSTRQVTAADGVQTPAPILPRDIERISSDKFTMMNIASTELARQITLLDFEAYALLNAGDLFNASWTSVGGPDSGPGLARVIDRFNHLADLAATEIACAISLERRAKMIARWIEIADECRKLNNFSAVMAICSALQTTAIFRLKRSWALVPGEHTDRFHQLKSLMMREGNYATYRRTLRASQPPIVPYIGVVITDLTFIEDGNTNTLESHPQLINFAKRRRLANALRGLLEFQSTPYNLEPVMFIQQLVTSGIVFRESEIYDISIKLEAKLDSSSVSSQVESASTSQHGDDVEAHVRKLRRRKKREQQMRDEREHGSGNPKGRSATEAQPSTKEVGKFSRSASSHGPGSVRSHRASDVSASMAERRSTALPAPTPRHAQTFGGPSNSPTVRSPAQSYGGASLANSSTSVKIQISSADRRKQKVVELRRSFFDAVRRGNREEVTSLLWQGVSLEDTAPQMQTALHVAAYESQAKLLAYLLSSGIRQHADTLGMPQLNARDRAGWTALHSASSVGSLECCEVLLSNGADPKIANNDENLPLHFLCRRVIEQDTKSNKKSKRADRHKRLQKRSKDNSSTETSSLTGSVSLLSSADANLDIEKCAPYERILRLMVENGANPDSVNADGDTPLHQAAAHGNVDALRALIRLRANLKIANKVDETPLDIANAREHTLFAEHLLAHTRATDIAPKQHQRSMKKIQVDLQDPVALARVIRDPDSNVPFKTHRHYLLATPDAISGCSLVDWMMGNLAVRTRRDAEELCQSLLDASLLTVGGSRKPVRKRFAFKPTANILYTLVREEDAPVAVDTPRKVKLSDFKIVHVLKDTDTGRMCVARLKSGSRTQHSRSALANKTDSTKRDASELVRQFGLVYAIKVIEKATLEEDAVELLLAEKMILQNDSPFLTQLYYTFQTKAALFMVLDFCPGGNLGAWLAREERFEFERTQFVACEMVLALEYLHAHGVVYRDLKPENVLVGSDGHLLLADFGMAKVMTNTLTHTAVGTPLYCAPEILEGAGYSRSVDLWALGVVIYQMLLGFTPFEVDDDDFGQLIKSILTARILYPADLVSHNSRSLLSQLLQRDPKLRLDSFDEIKHHDFFEGIDFAAVQLKKIQSPLRVEITSDDDISYYGIQTSGVEFDELEAMLGDAATKSALIE